MDSNTELDQLRDEVFKKIGRNVVNFQKIEGMLKFLLSVSQTEGPISRLPEISEQNRSRVERNTLGALVRAFHERARTNPEAESAAPPDLSEIWVRTHVALDDSAFLVDNASSLQSLAEERNDLIHQFIPRWNLDLLADLQQASRLLDDQRTRVIPIFDGLRAIVSGVVEAMARFDGFMRSDRGQEFVDLMFIQSSRVVRCLTDFVAKHRREDGWASFSGAGLAVRQDPHALKQLDQFKSEFGFSSLKEIAIASRMFEFKDEPTSRGSRLVFRFPEDVESAARTGSWIPI